MQDIAGDTYVCKECGEKRNEGHVVEKAMWAKRAQFFLKNKKYEPQDKAESPADISTITMKLCPCIGVQRHPGEDGFFNV